MATMPKRLVVMALLGALVMAMVLALPGPARAAVADLSIRKTTPADTVRVGESFNWTLRVANRGPGSASGVEVIDTLPVSVRLLNVVSSQGGPCDVDFPRVVCNPGTIASGETATIRLTVRATQSGSLRNRARVDGSSTDANAANNRAVSVVVAR